MVNEPSVFEPLKFYCTDKRKRVFDISGTCGSINTCYKTTAFLTKKAWLFKALLALQAR